MYGTLASFMIGTMAIETGVSRPPNSTATFSLWTSSRAAITPLAGVASSSRRTSSNFLPSAPPEAFSSSMATCRPRVMASPARADCPERAVTRPILIVSCANTGRAAKIPTVRNRIFLNIKTSLNACLKLSRTHAMLGFRNERSSQNCRGIPPAAHDPGPRFGAAILRPGLRNPLYRQPLDARPGRGHRLQQGALQVGEEEVRPHPRGGGRQRGGNHRLPDRHPLRRVAGRHALRGQPLRGPLRGAPRQDRADGSLERQRRVAHGACRSSQALK